MGGVLIGYWRSWKAGRAMREMRGAEGMAGRREIGGGWPWGGRERREQETSRKYARMVWTFMATQTSSYVEA
eukprot:765939-Hanusia_phi.AAC.4